MTLDQYQLCPCGSGKKIKFCCSKDLLHDLERIERMIQGDQRLAAIDKIDSLLESHPNRPSLLMLKAEIQMQLNEPQNARETVDALAAIDPDNPSVTAMKSLLAVLVDRNVTQAIDFLQTAFEQIKTGSVTSRMYEAIVVLGNVLQRLGATAAAKGHLQLALALSGAKDERCAQSLMQLNQARQIPLLLREPLNLKDCPENVTWQIEFQASMNEIFRGCWRSGADKLSAMSTRILDAPSILWNLAVVRIWLGQNDAAVRALEDFARIREVPLAERVDAMALAEYLDPQNQANVIEIAQRTYEVDQLDPVMEQCLASPQLLRRERDPNVPRPEGTPLPRAMFECLDRPIPDKTAGLSPSELPESLGAVALYGRETDRAARIEIFATRGNADRIKDVLEPLVEGGLGEVKHEQVVDGKPWIAAEVFRDWHIPDDMEIDERRRLMGEIRALAINERLTSTPVPMFEGKTLAEAIQDSKYKIKVMGLLLNLEILAQDANWDVDFSAVRDQLSLPAEEPLDPATIDFERVPIHRLAKLDVSSLTDDQLLEVYRRAYSVMSVDILRRAALDVIHRTSLDKKIDKVEAYDILSDVAPTTDEALEYLEKARKLATAEGESPAAWLVDELEIRLLRGEADRFVSILREIQTRYAKEPGIMPSLVEMLNRYGLVTPDGRIAMPAPRDAAAAAKAQEAAVEGAGIWTGDSEAPASTPAAEEKPESKLWIPGMD